MVGNPRFQGSRGRQTHGPPPPETAAAPHTDNLLKGYALDIAPQAAPSSRPRAPSPTPVQQSEKQSDFYTNSPPPQNDEEEIEVAAQPSKKRNRNKAQQQQQQHTPHDVSKKIGRARLMSRIAGIREATPDQDDIRAPSDDDGEDVMAAVAAAVARDKAVEEELAKERENNPEQMNGHMNIREAYYGNEIGGYYSGGDSGDDDEDTMKNVHNTHKQPGKPPLHKLDDTRSDTDEEGEGDVVEFAYGDSAYPEIRERKKKKRARWESIGGPAPSVRPGTLTHAGAGDAAPLNELFATTTNNKSISNSDTGEMTFTGLGLHPPLGSHLESLGFKNPTRVQQETIPILLSGKDALVNAPTGSGKTLSYVAPIMNDLATATPRITRADGTLALIICPTRELCLQVVDALTLIARRFVWVVPGAVHGGENRAKEKARLRKGVNVLVTTPGRLLDHLDNTTSFNTSGLRWLVLDEADRLLDLGFEKKIAEILDKIGEKVDAAGGNQSRRSVLLSATLHGGLGGLAGLSLQNPVAVGWNMTTDAYGKIVVQEENDVITKPEGGGGGGGALQNSAPLMTKKGSSVGGIEGSTKQKTIFDIPKQLRQGYADVPCKLRLVALAAVLRSKIAAAPNRAKILVFFSNCDSVEFHHSVLSGDAWEAASGGPLLPTNAPLLKMHGNMAQGDRTSSLLRFTKAGAGVLLCTDVAARGLDFPAVTAIIQFDPPGTAEEYVHRVGRTARLGHAGEALLFIQPAEKGYIGHLKSHGVTLQAESLTSAFDKTLGMDAKAGKGLPIERHHGGFRLQREIMDTVAGDKGLRSLAETAFRSYVRAYATHSTELKPFFNVKSLHLGHVAHSFGLK